MTHFLRRRWKLLARAFLLLYVASYLILSRRGLEEAKQYNLKGFFYVPAQQAFASRNWEELHYKLAVFYGPANAIDREVGAGEGPVRCILRGLSR